MAELEPTRGSEMQKTRPVVILSSNTLRPLPVRIIIPLTGWQEHFCELALESAPRAKLEQ